MSSIFCSTCGHPNPVGANFCSACGDSLTSNAAQTPPTLAAGKLLRDRYRIRESLGAGGFGRTYLVEDTGRFDEKLVLKEFSPAQQGTSSLQKAVELFRREAVTLYQLEHPQIPKFWEIFQAESRLFLVEDFVEGHTYEALLNERVRQRRCFSEVEVLKLLQDLLPVLTYIHRQGIIHRDISPDNIILSAKSGLPSLIDLGAAKQTVINATVVNTATTPRATSIGKTGYSPDEQIRLGIVAPHSDLYALAVTAIVLMTGKQPSQLLDQYSLQWNWDQEVTVNPAFAQTINRMLAPRPDQRFQSADDVLNAIKPLLSNGTASPVDTHPAADTANSQPTVVSPPDSSWITTPISRNPANTPPSAPAAAAPNPAAPTEVSPGPTASAPTEVTPAPNKYYSVPNSVPPSAPTPPPNPSAPTDFASYPDPAVSSTNNNSGSGKIFDSTIPVPEEIKGWNWGAFLLGAFWSVGNKVWIGLICFIPWVGWIMLIFLSVKGNEWAWKSKRWASVEQFKATQRKWTIAGLIAVGIFSVIGFLIGLSGY